MAYFPESEMMMKVVVVVVDASFHILFNSNFTYQPFI
jgi:hypothetical protein